MAHSLHKGSGSVCIVGVQKIEDCKQVKVSQSGPVRHTGKNRYTADHTGRGQLPQDGNLKGAWAPSSSRSPGPLNCRQSPAARALG
ncbi:hypothetical protein UY3_13535 [Chelonia mydas]|uniref:Uncharacterized protein n=1 Tax=Chelonia mydas TaxID=8469 RepID=M7BMC6_CHEMY|nr:hypothetical protein UY3_13535 [Chelonia mydas]